MRVMMQVEKRGRGRWAGIMPWGVAAWLAVGAQVAWGAYSGSGTFTKINTRADLTDGYYVMASSNGLMSMTHTNYGSFFTNGPISPSADTLTDPPASIVWLIQTNATYGGLTIFNEASNKYVAYQGTANAAYAANAVNGTTGVWTFTYATGVFNCINVASNTRVLQYNSAAPRFACYTTVQQKLALYKMASGGEAPSFTSGTGPYGATSGVAMAFTVTASGSPSPALALQGTTAASGYSFTPGTGVLNYTPPQADGGGTRTFTFTASNSVGVATQTVNVAVTAGTAPSFTSGTSYGATSGVAMAFTVVATGTPGPALALQGETAAGSVSFNSGTGVLDYTPATNDVGTQTFTFTASNVAGVATQAVSVTVANIAVAPSFTSGTSYGATSLVAMAFTVMASGNPSPSLALQSQTASSGYGFTPATGVLDYTPPTNDVGTQTFTFTASNSAGVATQTVSVSVAAALTSIPAVSVTNIATNSFTVNWTACTGATNYQVQIATDTNFTAGGSGTNALEEDFATLTDTAVPSGWTTDKSSDLDYTSEPYVGAAAPAYKFATTAQWLQSPAFSTGATNLQFWAYGNGGSGSTIAVSALVSSVWTLVDTVSIASNDATYNVALNPLTTQLKFVFTKVVNCALDDIVVQTSSAGGSIVADATVDALTYNATGLEMSTTYYIRARMLSTGEWSSVVSATTASPEAAAPVFGANPGPVAATATVAAAFTVTASGYPAPALALQGTTASTGYGFTPATGALNYTPPTNDVGTKTFTFTASNTLGVATQTVTVTVAEAPAEPPTIDPVGSLAVPAGQTTNIWIVARESNGDTITLSASNLPANASFTTATGTGAVSNQFSFSPVAGQAGQSYSVVFYASDVDGTNSRTLGVTVPIEDPWADYYASCYSNGVLLTGTALKNALHNIIDAHTNFSYDALWNILQVIDECPTNNTMVQCLYLQHGLLKTNYGGLPGQWNREHVWANSHGINDTLPGYTDLHHMHPTEVVVNSTRGNLDFDTVDGLSNSYSYSSTAFEPPDAGKGDVARAMFYMAVRYSGEGDGTFTSDLELTNSIPTDGVWFGKLSTLMDWNELDPTNNYEIRRNNLVYTNYQGNRNPFVDHPEWARVVFDTNYVALPSAPASFAATANSQSQISLTFSLNGTGDDVIIVWDGDGSFTAPTGTVPAVGAAFAGGTVVYKGGASPQSHTGLTSCATYYYKCWSYSGTNYSTAGLTASATTAGPDAPSGVRASATNATDFTAAWNAVTGASGYRLDVATDTNFFGGSPGGLTLINEDFTDFSDWADFGTAEDTTHYGAASPCRALVNLNTLTSPGVDYPTQMTFYVDASAGGEGMTTTNYYSLDGGSTWTPVAPFTCTTAGTTVTQVLTSAPNLSGSTNVKFRFVSAFSTWYLDDVKVTGGNVAPSSYVAGYSNLAVSGATSTNVTGLAVNTTYYFRVRAVDGSCTSTNSATASVTTTNTTPRPLEWTALYDRGRPLATGFLGDYLSTNFEFAVGTATNGWTAQYGLGLSQDGSGWTWTAADWSRLDGGTGRVFKARSGVSQFASAGTWYYAGRFTTNGYAYYAAGDWTTNTGALAATNYITVLPLNEPDGIGVVSATNPTSAIDLLWDKDAQGHDVMVVRKLAASSWTEPTPGLTYAAGNTLGAGTVVYVGAAIETTDAGLAEGTTYDYKFYSVNNGYYSAGVTDQEATLGCAPDAPAGLYASATNSTGFTASWNASSRATNYFLDVSTNADFGGSGSAAPDLLISEYVEGSGSEKFIEIFNGTGAGADLSDYALLLFANGTNSPTASNTLSGTLASGAVAVYRNPSATNLIGVTNAAVNFNGDDAVALWKISTASFVDIFGSIGFDPGTAWSNETFTTVNKTLVRKSSVGEGLTNNPATNFPTLGTEWDLYDQDTLANLGAHTFDGGGVPSYVAGYSNFPAGNVTSCVVTGLTNNGTYYFRVRAQAECVSSNSSTASATILQKSDQTISFPAIADQVTTNEVTLSATASSGLPVSFAVAGGPAEIAGTILTFTGAGTVSVVASQAGDANWNAAPSVTNTFNVGKASASVTLGSLAQTYDGGAKNATATTEPAGLTVEFAYDGAGVAPTAAGSYAVTGTVSDAMYQGTASGTLVVSKASAAVFLGNLSQVYDGTARTVSATTTPAGLTVEFTYEGNAWAPTNAGSYAVTGTVNDANYEGTASGTLVVSTASAVVTLGSLAQTYDGGAKNATATTEPAGLTVEFTYDGSATPPAAVGSYAVTGTVSDANYAGTSSGTLVISKASAVVTLGNLAQTYDGGAKNATATTEPAGLTVEFTYDGSGTAPSSAGSYAVTGTVSDASYEGFAVGTLVISKATAVVALGDLSQVYDGTARTVSATTTPAGLTVEFTYDGSAAAPTNAGSYAVTGTVNDANYEGSSAGTLEVSKASQSISFPAIGDQLATNIVALSATATSGLEVTFMVTSGPASISGGTNLSFTGAGTVGIAATQAGDGNWDAAPGATNVFNVDKAPATVELGNLAQSYDGTARIATATTEPAGLAVDLTYDGNAWAPTNAGSYEVVATIDEALHQGSTTGTLVVSQASEAAIVILDDLAQTYDGTPKAATATTDPAGLEVEITYDGSATAPTAAGSYAVTGTVKDINYSGSTNGILVISKAAAAVALGDLSQVYDGTARTVSATTTPAGLTVEFTYDGFAAAPTNAGSYAVTGTVNDANYEGSSAGMLVVSKAAAVVTLGSLAQTYDGDAKSATATTEPAGLTVEFTYDGIATLPTEAGSYSVTGTVNDANYQGASAGTLVISKAAASVALSDLDHVYDGAPKSATVTTAPSGLVVSVTYDGSGTAPSITGSYEVVATVSEANYAGSATGTLVIASALSPFQLWVRDEQGQSLTDSNFVENADYDFDGMTTWEEYLADTDPATNASVFVVTGRFTTTDRLLRISFPASTNRYYRLECCTNLTNAASITVSNLGWGVPGMVITNPPQTSGRWFWAIRSGLAAP